MVGLKIRSIRSIASRAIRRVTGAATHPERIATSQYTRTQGFTLKFTGTAERSTFDAAVAKQAYWYHSYRFDNGFEIAGGYDIGIDINGYGFPDDMRGMRILDIGPASGWFSFLFEQRGAEVVACDIRGNGDWDIFGRSSYISPEQEQRSPDAFDDSGHPLYLTRASSGFWLLRNLLNSKVRLVNSRIYDITPELFDNQMFDLVFVGSLLLHLRDPIGALMAVHNVCDGQVIATSPIHDGGQSKPQMILNSFLDGNVSNKRVWWLPNAACYSAWFLAAGFRSVNTECSLLLQADAHDHATQMLRLARADV